MKLLGNLFGRTETDDHDGYAGHAERAPRDSEGRGTWMSFVGGTKVSGGHSSRDEALRDADSAARRAARGR